MGARIKHYEILRSLGRGGFAGVLLARDTRLDRLVALKVPLRRKHGRARLLAEAQTLARLVHENIVMVYDVDGSGEPPYMTLEYVRGRTLRELIRPTGLRPEVALEVMLPVVRALAHAHDLGIVHRDLKPQNIMVADAGAIKLVDFGLARSLRTPLATEHPASPLPAGSVRFPPPLDPRAPHPPPAPQRGRPWAEGRPGGTLLYMAPEQVTSNEVDLRCDLWAVGIILHELLTGAHPLAPFPPGWLSRVLDPDEPLPLSVGPGRAAGALREVIEKCVKKKRAERFSSARDLASALEGVARKLAGLDGTWTDRVRRFKRDLARRAFEQHGSYAVASAALRVGRRTLRDHADSMDGPRL